MCAEPRRASRSPVQGEELRMLTALRKEYPDSGYVFTIEHGTPFTADAINRLVKIIGQRAGLALPVHFQMLLHSCASRRRAYHVRPRGYSLELLIIEARRFAIFR
jgi:hypothetical protein